MTHRQYLVWSWWLDEQWNSPSRSDYYLMQIAAEALYSNRKRPKSYKLDRFKVPFKKDVDGEPKKVGPTPEQLAAWSKARWYGLLGGKGKVKVVEVARGQGTVAADAYSAPG